VNYNFYRLTDDGKDFTYYVAGATKYDAYGTHQVISGTNPNFYSTYYVPISCEVYLSNNTFGTVRKKRSTKIVLHAKVGGANTYEQSDAMLLILEDDEREPYIHTVDLLPKGSREKFVEVFNTGIFNSRKYTLVHCSISGPFIFGYLHDELLVMPR
jgi:hypothetical protein